MYSIMFKNFLFLLVLSLKLKFYIGEKSPQFLWMNNFLREKVVKEISCSELRHLPAFNPTKIPRSKG